MSNVLVKQVVNGKAMDMGSEWDVVVEHLPKAIRVTVTNKKGGNVDMFFVGGEGSYIKELYPRTYSVQVL